MSVFKVQVKEVQIAILHIAMAKTLVADGVSCYGKEFWGQEWSEDLGGKVAFQSMIEGKSSSGIKVQLTKKRRTVKLEGGWNCKEVCMNLNRGKT